MGKEGTWLINPETDEEQFYYWDELPDEAWALLAQPIGGFCHEASNFVRLPLAKVPYYIRDWLPKHGKSLIYAPAKTGKSYLALQMARCIGQGVDFIGIPTTQGRVLYLQFELGEEVLQARMLSTGQTYDEVFLGTTFSMKLNKTSGQHQLVAAMEDIQPQVLIADPLYKVVGGDENNTEDMLQICDFFDTVIEAYDCSIMLFHHPGKDISKGGRGSSVMEDWVDSYLQMKQTDGRVQIKPQLLRHAELPPEPINLIFKDFEFVLANAPETVEDKILAFIESAPEPVGPKDIIGVGIGANTSVAVGLNRLVQLGQIERVSRGQYRKVG